MVLLKEQLLSGYKPHKITATINNDTKYPSNTILVSNPCHTGKPMEPRWVKNK